MGNSLIPMDNSGDINVFNRPGGTLAKIVTAAGIGGGLYGVYLLAPAILALFQNLFYAAAFLVGLLGLVFVVTSKDFQRNFKLGFSMLMWKITGWFVKMDPVSILKRGIEKMIAKQDLIEEKIDKIQGIYSGMKRTLGEKRSLLQKEVKILAEYEKREMTDQVILSKNKIARLDTQIKNLEGRIAQCEKYLDVLKQLEKMVKFKVADSKDQVQYMVEEYESAKKTQEAVGAIKSIMRGFSNSREEQMAADVMWSTVNDSIGEIDRFLDGSNDLLINFTAESAANATKADEILEEYKKNGFQALEQMGTKGALPQGKSTEKVKEPIMAQKSNGNNENVSNFF